MELQKLKFTVCKANITKILKDRILKTFRLCELEGHPIDQL